MAKSLMNEPCPSSQPHGGFHFQMQPDIEVVDNGMPERPRKVVVLALQFCLPECQLSSIGSGFVRVHDCTNVVLQPSSRPQWSRTTLPCPAGIFHLVVVVGAKRWWSQFNKLSKLASLFFLNLRPYRIRLDGWDVCTMKSYSRDGSAFLGTGHVLSLNLF